MLIDLLPDEITFPDATAIWEDKLHSMSEGEGTLEEFEFRFVDGPVAAFLVYTEIVHFDGTEIFCEIVLNHKHGLGNAHFP